MGQLIDTQERRRFVEEVGQPFSVIAPAGVGKTHSIIERVAAMLKNSGCPVALVTYTKKAAEQMRRRLEERLKKAGMRSWAENIFIGTIHSLCAELMDKHAIEWNLPAAREIFADVESLWGLYVEEVADPLAGLPPGVRERYLSYFGGFDPALLLQIHAADAAPVFCAPPVFDFQKIFVAEFKGPQKKTHERLKRWTQEFLELSQIAGFVMPELPKAPDEGSPVAPLYEEVFGPFARWRAHEGMAYAQLLSQKFRAWRRARGAYVYDDLIEIVSEKAHSVARWSVVLDEAQDTSPAQLDLLKKISLEREGKLQFTLVGDPQQSIYSSRASLPDYLRMHRELIAQHGTQELTFRVTFRCARKIVEWANLLGPQLLQGGQTQASFVELFARPNASEGSVTRWEVDSAHVETAAGAEERDWIFASAFAKKLKALQLNPAQLHQVAVLAPRREWLFKLAEKLTAEGFRVQLHAQTSSATPAERILHAVVHLMRYPFDSFELVGFLRELSAVDDVALARAAQQTPEALTLLAAPDASKLPPELFAALDELFRAREEGKRLPLDLALAAFIRVARLDEKIRALDLVYKGTLLPAWEQEKMRVLALVTPGKTCAELLRDLQNESADAPIEPGALQLMTMHKAKGLEWQAVFLPFLHRPLNLKAPRYPALDPADPHRRLTWKIPTQQSSIPENENFLRLLYVALTRAKENLILVDDSAFYPPEFSLAQLLRLSAGGAFHQDFVSLPTQLELALPPEELKTTRPPVGNPWESRPPVLPVVTPSGLPPASDDEEEPASVIPSGEKGGLNYGEVWHAAWHRVFLHNHGRIEDLFLTEMKDSPFFARAQKELELLRASALWAVLNTPHAKLSEVPFVARLPNAVMEGRVDVMIDEPQRVLIIDWKTDRLPPQEIARAYGAQVHAYQAALGALFKKPVEAKIYSTVHGVLL